MRKKLFIAFVCTIGLLGLTSCEEEHLYPNELQGHWVLMDSSTKDDGAAKSLLALTFEHDMLFVDGASSGQRPFSYSYDWEWYVNEDSELVIYYEDYDSDGDLSRSTYYLDWWYDERNDELTLEWDPLLGSDKHYVFMRR